MTPEELEVAVLEGDVGRVMALIRGASEVDRRAAGSRALALQKRSGSFKAYRAETTKLDGYRSRASTLSLLGTGSAAQIRSGSWMRSAEGAFELLSCRPPELLLEITPWLIDTYRWDRGWERVRQLVRSGAMPRPECDEYYLGMLSDRLPRAHVLEDPELLEHEIWRLFEIEGTQELSLADHDKFGWSWAEVFLGLAASDLDKRTRFLDASLAALERDFIAFRAGWFSRFHEALKPTDDERAGRTTVYLRLLRSPIPATVSMAAGALSNIQKAGRLDGAELLAYVTPALQARAAGTAKSALRLIDRAVRTKPALAPRASVVATEGLSHASADVQAAALAIIEKAEDRSDGALAVALARHRDDVSVSLRKRFNVLGGPAPAASPAAPAPAAELPARASGDPFATLQRISPIETLPELVEAIAHVYETSGPPDEIERVLDGVSRLSAERPPDFDRLVRPIRKRADQIQARRHPRDREVLGAYGDGNAAVAVAALVAAWVDGVEPVHMPAPRVTLGCYLVGRVAEIAHWAVARTAEPMLAAPTHTAGWIEPNVLVDRLVARLQAGRTDEKWFWFDMIQAMLRLLPLGREEALARARSLPTRSECVLALRHALGDQVRIGPTQALWIAAARCRNPDGDDPVVGAAHGGLGAGGAEAGRFSLAFVSDPKSMGLPALATDPRVETLSSGLPTVLLSVERTSPYGLKECVGFIDWLRLIWPQSRRSWFAVSATVFAGNIDWWQAEWENRRRLEPLFEPWTAIGPEAALLLAVALQAKEPGEQGLAVEAAIALIADGRLRLGLVSAAFAALEELMAEQPERHYPRRLLQPHRFAGAMERVAAASAFHAGAGQEILASTLAFFASTRGHAPVPVGQLASPLRLPIELGAQLGRPVPESTRPTLARVASGKGETARLAGQLLSS